jgi:hypothetical protein
MRRDFFSIITDNPTGKTAVGIRVGVQVPVDLNRKHVQAQAEEVYTERKRLDLRIPNTDFHKMGEGLAKRSCRWTRSAGTRYTGT